MHKIIFLISVLFLVCCRENTSKEIKKAEGYSITVRIDDDPGRLNPLFAKRTISRKIFPYLFLPLAEFNPESLKFDPILATELPRKTFITTGKYKGGVQFDIEILAEASWIDGKAITAYDYLFTMLALKHPKIYTQGIKPLYADVVNIEIDDNPKKIRVILKEDYMVAMEAISSLEILPAHIYDPASTLKNMSIEQLENPTYYRENIKDNVLINEFVNQFNSVEYHKKVMSGAGPYYLEEWIADEYLHLVKKENWWGGKFIERPFLRAYPQELIFQIIPDETTSLLQLKNGNVDLLEFDKYSNFSELRDNDTFKEDFEYFETLASQYYFVQLNNNHKILSNKNVRKAIANMLNVDQLIKSLEGGSAEKITGPILPSSLNYNESLSPVKYDLENAKRLLDEANWLDTNDNGIRDNIIDGHLTELTLRVFTSPGGLGLQMALFIAEAGKEVGIDFQIVQKEFRNVTKEHLRKNDFELVMRRLSTSLSDFDPHSAWHSSNASSSGRNVSYYQNKTIDELIEKIHDSEAGESRKELYKEFQRIVYEDQVNIYLYAPKIKIAVSKKFKPLISIKRPGYFLNSFQFQGEFINN